MKSLSNAYSHINFTINTRMENSVLRGDITSLNEKELKRVLLVLYQKDFNHIPLISLINNISKDII